MQPFGKILLGAVALGLVGYALWRLVQAGIDAESKGTGAKGLAIRTGYAISGFIHLGLALTAMRLAFDTDGRRSSSGSSDSQDWTAAVLAQPFGRWLVALAGGIIIGVGIGQLYKAYTAKFRDNLKLGEMSAAEQLWATRSGKLGLVARGIVFALIGFFVMQAAWRYDSGNVQGVGGALDSLASGPFGSITFPVVALGLIAYGLFMFVQARYRRINTT